MNKFQPNRRVCITGQEFFENDELRNAHGIVIQSDNVFINVMITSGKLTGNTHKFMSSQLSLVE